MPPKTNTATITNGLKELSHQVSQINNMVKLDTKQPLPLFFIELEPSEVIYSLNLGHIQN